MSWKGVPIEGLVWLAGRFNQTKPLPSHESPKSVLVLRPNDLGDLLTVTPIFEALRNRFPSAYIIAGVGSWGKQILQNNPFVDEIVEFDAPWNNKVVKDQSWRAMLSYIFRSKQVSSFGRRGGVDVGIDIVGTHVGSLLMMRLGVRYRIGVRGYRGGWSACHKYIRFQRRTHVTRATLEQAKLLGVTVLPELRPQIYLTEPERTEANRIWAVGGRMPGAIKLLVACGAGMDDKCWPAENFGRALLSLWQAYDTPARSLNVLLVGGPADQEKAAKVLATGIPHATSVCASLRAAFALAEQADLVLTNSSMMLHVAAAFSRPTVAVIGGVYLDAAEHDIGWGYPPPYYSVGPLQGESWPSVDRVVAAVENTLESSSRQIPNPM